MEIFFPDIDELDYLKNSVALSDNEMIIFKGFLNNKDTADDFIIEVGDDRFNSVLSVE